jgi:hypothetical protein
LFKKITLQLENGNKILIDAPANNNTNRYIQSISLNGKQWDKNWLSHSELMKGATIRFNMAAMPNKLRGTTNTAYPYSFSIEHPEFIFQPQNYPGKDLSEIEYSKTDTITKGGFTLIFTNKEKDFNTTTYNKMKDAFFKVYPELVNKYNPNSLKSVIFIIDPSYKGVAATSEGMVRFNPTWLKEHPSDIDVVTHEVMHIVQAYPNGAGPGWITEGIADYVRSVYGIANKEGGWALPAWKESQHYTNSYRVTARFLAWIEMQYPGFVNKLDAAMRNKSYSDDIWKQATGMTLEELWKEYTKKPE